MKRRFNSLLPPYFFIFVKVIGKPTNDQRSCFVFFLIFVAKRFNTAYYLLLDAGDSSGAEISKWLTFVACSGNERQNCRTPEVLAATGHRSGELWSLFLFGNNFLLHIVDATEKFLWLP